MTASVHGTGTVTFHFHGIVFPAFRTFAGTCVPPILRSHGFTIFRDDMMQPLPPVRSLAVFLPFAVLLYLQTHGTIPWLSRSSGVEAIFFWFVVGGLGVFLPMLIAAWLMLRRERPLPAEIWTQRLRFRRMNAGDWWWSIGGIVAAGAGSGLVMQMVAMLGGAVPGMDVFSYRLRLATARDHASAALHSSLRRAAPPE
jgi:hypothetical protein